jgi:cytoskeletal protein RodZ
VESLGDKLKNTRTAKGYSIDYVSQETNIASRYLQALEQENFEIFPSEAYALGFLKNYGAYLDLDVNELLSLYRTLKIQEQPVPVKDFVKVPSQISKILVIIAIVLAALALALGAYWFFTTQFTFPERRVVENNPTRSPVEYIMNTDFLERRFYLGDTVLIPLEEETYKLELSLLSDTVTLNTPVGLVRLDLSQEASVDLDGDGFAELRIIVADFARNDSQAGVLLRIELESLPGAEAPQIVSTEVYSPSSQVASVIFTSTDAYPFTLQAVFQGYCLFRWEVLFEANRQGRNEQYFQQSDELSVQAQNGIRIGLSNAQAVRLQVIGGGRTVPLEIGGPGEVVVADVRWIRDEENRYRLVLARLE